MQSAKRPHPRLATLAAACPHNPAPEPTPDPMPRGLTCSNTPAPTCTSARDMGSSPSHPRPCLLYTSPSPRD
eukprot:14557850-Alexandrium_andersonii.AAC.1